MYGRKTILIALLLTVAVGCFNSLIGGDREDIIRVLKTYAQATDTRNADLVSGALHSSGHHLVQVQGRLLTFSPEQYLGLLREGKIGGKKRSFALKSVDVSDGAAASAKIELTTEEKVRFSHYFTLMKIEGQWKIMDILSSVKPLDSTD